MARLSKIILLVVLSYKTVIVVWEKLPASQVVTEVPDLLWDKLPALFANNLNIAAFQL